MSAPFDSETVRREFERLVLMDPAIGVSSAAGYGLLLLHKNLEQEKELQRLRLELETLVRSVQQHLMSVMTTLGVSPK